MKTNPPVMKMDESIQERLAIRITIFATICIVFPLSTLGLFSPSTDQAMYITVSLIGLIGIVAGLIVFSRYKIAGTQTI